MEEQPALPDLLPGLLEAVTTVAKLDLPDASDIYYYRNMPDYKQLNTACSSQIEQLLRTARTNLTRPSTTAATASLAADDDDLDEALYEDVISVLDDTFERLDTALDASKLQTEQYKLGGWATTAGNRQAFRAVAKGLDHPGAAGLSRNRIQRHVANLPRPQDSFPDPADNSNTPWSPSKFNHVARKLAAATAASRTAVDKLQAHAAQLSAAAGGSKGSGSSSAAHPYGAELSRLTYEPWQLDAPAELQPAADLSDTPFTYVETPEQLSAMIDELRGEKQIAIDLEHHSYRSFQGFSCLMQISTRSHDFVVDCLSLRAHLGPALADIMADACVEKVLHGADHDVLWLQRDFGLYIVNLFDTGQAARVLNYPSASLAHLLERHAGFKADKRYQLADWRVRPLSPDMLHYARCDTHFLLAVSDVLRKELLAAADRVPEGWSVPVPQHAGAGQTALGVVLERSRQLCCSTYQKPLFTEHSYIEQAARWQLNLPAKNMAVFAALFAWRDRTARALDESVSYVMPKAALIELSRAAPQTAAEVRKLLGAAYGLAGGSGLLVSRADEVVQVILHGQQQAALPAAAPVAAAAAVGGSSKPAAVEVKPREVPAIKPKSGIGLTAKKPGGMKGLFGASGKPSAAASATPAAAAAAAVTAAAEPTVAPADHQQQSAVTADTNAAQHKLQQVQQGQQTEQQQRQQQLTTLALTAADQQQQQPHPEPVTDAPAADAPAPKQVSALLPKKRSGSSLAGLLSSKPKLQHTAQQQQQQQQQQQPADKAASIRAESFKLPFLSSAAANGTAGGSNAVVTAPSKLEEQQQLEEEAEEPAVIAVTGAEVRAVVDQLMAESDQQQEEEANKQQQQQQFGGDGASDEDAAGDGSSALADLEYVPLSEQMHKKKKYLKPDRRSHQQQPAAAATASDPAAKRRRVEGANRAIAVAAQREPLQAKPKRGGIFADAAVSDSDDGSSSDGGSDDGLLPSYDPTAARKAAAAAARDKQQQQPGRSAGNDGQSDQASHRGGRGQRGGRGDRGGRGRGRSKRGAFMAAASASLAAVRAKQGGGGVGANPFAIPDNNLMRGGKRSAVAPRGGNRSASFK